MLNRALKAIRLYNKLKQKELASILKISRSHLSEVESGIKNASPKLLEAYSSFFDIPISGFYLISEALERNDGKIVVTRKIVPVCEQIIGGECEATNVRKRIIMAFV